MGFGIKKDDVTIFMVVKKCHKNVTGKKTEKNCHSAGRLKKQVKQTS